MQKLGLGLLVFVWLAGMVACKKENSEEAVPQWPLRFTLEHKAAGSTMILGAEITNPHGEPLTLTQFKYYLSNFSLTRNDGVTVNLSGYYFLVDEKTPASKSFTIDVPEGQYTSVSFLLGVDSARNVSGVQEGALDPVNGMFWTWNSGYIMAKMEGKSVLSTAPLQNVTYHIGGFRQAESVLKTITFPMPAPIQMRAGSEVELVIEADADKWFIGPQAVRIANEPFCMEPGALAMKVAANYALMFTLKEVKVK